MKTLFTAIAFVFALAFAVPAQTPTTKSVKLAWDYENAPANLKYFVYEKVGTTYTKLGESTAPSYTVSNVALGTHTYVVTAVSEQGFESFYSNEAQAFLPVNPTNLRVVVEVSVSTP